MITRRQDQLEFAMILRAELTSKGYKGANRVVLAQAEFKTAELADKLIRAAGRIHRLAEGMCNREYGSEAAYERACNRVAKLLKPYGITAIFSGDPRGASIKLVLPATKRTNGWGGEGWCVPW